MRTYMPILSFILIFLFSCKTKTTEDKGVTIDHTFQKVFYPDSGGVTGADGVFSICVR